jgi:hypothetical protein
MPSASAPATEPIALPPTFTLARHQLPVAGACGFAQTQHGEHDVAQHTPRHLAAHAEATQHPLDGVCLARRTRPPSLRSQSCSEVRSRRGGSGRRGGHGGRTWAFCSSRTVVACMSACDFSSSSARCPIT